MTETQKKSIREMQDKQVEDCDFSAQQVLDFMKQNANIDVDTVLEDMKEKERNKLLKKCHPYKIWQSTDGRWKTYVADETLSSGRRQVSRKTKKQIEEFLIVHYQMGSEFDQRRQYTLRKLFPEWLNHKALSAASTYIARIKSDWKTYYLNNEIIDIPIPKLDKLTLEEWALKLIKIHDPKTGNPCNMTKNQYYNVTVIMRQELWYAVDRGIIDHSPFDQVKIDGRRLFRKVRKKPAYTQVFTVEEEKEITRMAWEDFHNRVKLHELAPLALLFQLKTGMRIGEISALEFSDIETPGEIHVQRMLRRVTKEIVDHTKGTSEDRYVILTSEAQELIEICRERQRELHVESEYIFSIDGNPLPERAVSTLYTKYCKNLGIVQKSSHKARKTYITSLINSGVGINTVRELAGHADEKTTLRNYTFDRSTDEEKRRQIEKALAV